jgi:hypothetical protein
LWKARVSGYEEATKLFNQWDGDDQNWRKVNQKYFCINAIDSTKLLNLNDFYEIQFFKFIACH